MGKESSQSWFSARLSTELSKEHNARSMPLRKDDTVIIIRGIFRDIEGKVTRVDRKKSSIYIEGATREKSDGSTIFVPINPSKVMITKLNLDDKWRKDILERKAFKPPKEAVEKPKPKVRKKTVKKSDSDAKESKGKE